MTFLTNLIQRWREWRSWHRSRLDLLRDMDARADYERRMQGQDCI